MGRRQTGREDGVPFREGRQVRGAWVRTATPREGRPRRGPSRRGEGRGADAPGGSGHGRSWGRSVPAARALAPALAGSTRSPRRRGRACPGPDCGPGAAGPPSAYRGGRAGGARLRSRGVGGGRAARGGPGAAAGEGALALPRRPLLSVCVCSKMAARLVPRDADAGPRGRPLRRRRLLPPRLPPARTRTASRAPRVPRRRGPDARRLRPPPGT